MFCMHMVISETVIDTKLVKWEQRCVFICSVIFCWRNERNTFGFQDVLKAKISKMLSFLIFRLFLMKSKIRLHNIKATLSELSNDKIFF